MDKIDKKKILKSVGNGFHYQFIVLHELCIIFYEFMGRGAFLLHLWSFVNADWLTKMNLFFFSSRKNSFLQ